MKRWCQQGNSALLLLLAAAELLLMTRMQRRGCNGSWTARCLLPMMSAAIGKRWCWLNRRYNRALGRCAHGQSFRRTMPRLCRRRAASLFTPGAQ
ncbi:MAG: hypothetical protein ACR5LF_12720 [Symbiopectobacterium sp.]